MELSLSSHTTTPFNVAGVYLVISVSVCLVHIIKKDATFFLRGGGGGGQTRFIMGDVQAANN